MRMRKGTVRGEVRILWEKAGKPPWDLKETIEVCISTVASLYNQGLNPAPVFREAILKPNTSYIHTWVNGCHFEWRNPR